MERLEQEVRRELGRFGPAAGMGPLVEAWPAAVGTAIAANAWPARLARDGTLVVNTRDSVWAFELTQQAGEVLERLGACAPARLRFVPGAVPEPAPETPSRAPARLLAPSAEEVAWGAAVAAVIDDEDLRRTVAEAAAMSLSRRADARSV
jgi:hypothetical protein